MSARAQRRRFLQEFARELRVVWPIVSGMLLIIALLGLAAGRLEGWSLQESLYFSFVTGLTIGFGDFVPRLLITRIFALGAGFTGILLTALLAAIAVRALGKVDEEPSA